MQVSGLGIGTTVSSLYKAEGYVAFWNGLFFAYGRELSYTSVKLGAYAPVRDALGDGKDSPFYIKFLAGAITGGTGSVIGNPFDVLKTLAQTSKDKVPLGQQVAQMYKDQGVSGFYRGVGVNVGRACVLNATKMVRYIANCCYVLGFDYFRCAGFVAGFRSCPFLFISRGKHNLFLIICY
jgi:Mitochondrial carrier protein